MAAPPTMGSVCAVAAKEVRASAAPAISVISDFFMLMFPFEMVELNEVLGLLLRLAVVWRRTSYLRWVSKSGLFEYKKDGWSCADGWS
jgi:hypothetical protein